MDRRYTDAEVAETLSRRSRLTKVVSSLDAVASDDESDRMMVALREVLGVAGRVTRSGTLRLCTATGGFQRVRALPPTAP